MYGYPNGGRHVGGDASMHRYGPYGYAPWGSQTHAAAAAAMPPPHYPPSRLDDVDDDEDDDDDEQEEEEEELNAEVIEENDDDEEDDDEEEEEEEEEIVGMAEIAQEIETEDEEEEDVIVEKSELLPKNRKRPRPSAFAYIQGLVREDSYEISFPAQTILKDLLREEHVHLAEPATDADFALQVAAERTTRSKRVVDADMADEEILDLAKKDELSYLGSFLKVVEEGNGEPVSARHLCRRCCLSVNPALVPCSMDAEDFCLAAMEFLEKTLPAGGHPNLPNLPLLQASKPEHDIRKRTYVKAYEWSLSEILESVVYLESLFLSDASDYKWLRREAFAPVTTDGASLDTLFLKGKYRGPSAKKKSPVARKKAKPVVSTNASANSSSLKKDPVATEASRIMHQTGSRSGDDSY